MAIVINGSGTVTGLGVGGLPDGTVDAGTLASGIDKTSITDGGNATAITIDSAENVGIGVVPEAWQSTRTALQVGDSTAVWGDVYKNSWFTNNVYRNSSNNECYINASYAGQITMTNGGVTHFKVAPSGSADATISWTTAMTIDNSGAVTMPSQPTASFGWTTQPIPTATIVPAEAIYVNIGSHLTSAGRFTAPIAGTYQYGFSGMANDASATLKVDLYKNGSLANSSTRAYTNPLQYSAASVGGYITLSANDYLEFRNGNAPLHQHYGQIHFRLVG